MVLDVIVEHAYGSTLRSFGYSQSQSQRVSVFGSGGKVLLFGKSRSFNRVQYGSEKELARRANRG